MAPDSHFPVHRYGPEQIMLVTGSALDRTVDGKLYRLKKVGGLILPFNLEHGDYISDKGCNIIDNFSPPHHDYVVKLEALRKGLQT